MSGTIVAANVFNAVVDAVFVADGAGFETRSVEALTLDFEGIVGDRHAGTTRRSGGREPWYPRRTEIRNERQVSIVARDELAEAASAMGIAALEPEWIGANLVLGGLEHLSWVPPRSRLLFAGGATIAIDGQNAPCRLAGAAIARHILGREDLTLLFPKAAKHLRGLVGWVEKPGVIRVGETVSVRVPVQRLYS
ncbi:MOSC domain-containing protein [Kaistia soli DSM 19436]|uniref:MOSC domain-containing protein n=1 Tax=Kaistia soli DSM 19436 TaxID=1122133 RepID=A0A1M4ZT64_9HYPH|nr:MOSC domain-containing protein [Kaistia soli]SHF21135.1 MOSC domain-containing protein [Kaistia soli DSM 19436]